MGRPHECVSKQHRLEMVGLWGQHKGTAAQKVGEETLESCLEEAAWKPGLVDGLDFNSWL